MFRKLLYGVLILGILFLAAGAAVGTWGYYYITRDLPQLSSIEDYRPPAVTRVLAADGTLVGEFYTERRYPVKISQVPPLIRNCFIASEDAAFYSHKGIDPLSILRATFKNLERGSARQGASTITQQVVKNLLLTSERSFKRKLKEAYLSYRIEQLFTKDEILELYLNQIFFGNTAYGIGAAAKLYFHKEVSQLTLAEGAILAGLPKAPSTYSPLASMQRAQRRQRYVLKQMVDANFITPEEAKAAENERIEVYPADMNKIFAAPYYVAEVRRLFLESPRWRSYNIDSDALEIHTALDITADRMAAEALRKGLKEADKRRGWRGAIANIPEANAKEFQSQFAASIPSVLETFTVYPALVTQVSKAHGTISVDIGNFTGTVPAKSTEWARKRLDSNDRAFYIQPMDAIKPGDIIEVSIKPRTPTNNAKDPAAPLRDPPTKIDSLADADFILDQTPEIEGSMVLLDPHTGRVPAAVGGYSYQRSVFNRVTQGLRQPGSAFKPVIYLAAVDGFGYTPSTIVYDRPRTFRVGDQYWTPQNFDKDYMGDITLRTALQHSRNLVSADIISRIGIEPVIKYAKLLGIQSKLGHNLSLSLGSSEVTMLEIARSYGVFAAKGVLFDSLFITKVIDRKGDVLFDAAQDPVSRAAQVIDENSAFIMANMMKGVVESGTGYTVKPINRPVAGKTGTSNDQMDAWFIGYTPEWVLGVWGGFDLKKTIGPKETGGRVSAPIWLYFMHDYLNLLDELNYAKLVEDTQAEAIRMGTEFVPPERLTPLDFSVPAGVEPFWINKSTGRLSDSGDPGAFYEYFVRDTEPNSGGESAEANTYLDSPEL